jgi:uncharacterized membrane protein YgcG
MQPFNPYAPPQPMAPTLAPGGFAGVGAWQEQGQVVLFSSGAVLPDRCAVCNAPGKHRVSKTFYWHEPWLYVLIFAGWIVYAIVAMILRKSANVEYWLCDEHRQRRTLGLVLVWTGFIVPFVGMLVAAGASSGALLVVCLVAMIALPIVGALLARGVRPARIDDAQVRLKAGAPFVASLPESPGGGGWGGQQGGGGWGGQQGGGGWGGQQGGGGMGSYGGPPPRW